MMKRIAQWLDICKTHWKEIFALSFALHFYNGFTNNRTFVLFIRILFRNRGRTLMTDMFEVDDEAIRNLVMLAKEGETMDPIDWGGLSVTEDQAYIMMATHVLEMERNHLTDGAIIVKLLVENFVLNCKLIGIK